MSLILLMALEGVGGCRAAGEERDGHGGGFGLFIGRVLGERNNSAIVRWILFERFCLS